MHIKTRDFGLLEVPETEIIRFPYGLFAFEDCTRFVLIEKAGCKQKWLQSAEAETPRFIVFNPADLVDGYVPDIPPEVRQALEASPDDQLKLYVIAVIPQNIREMTVNLKSPVIFNPAKRLAMQAIWEKDDYPIRYRVFQRAEKGVE